MENIAQVGHWNRIKSSIAGSSNEERNERMGRTKKREIYVSGGGDGCVCKCRKRENEGRRTKGQGLGGGGGGPNEDSSEGPAFSPRLALRGCLCPENVLLARRKRR